MNAMESFEVTAVHDVTGPKLVDKCGPDLRDPRQRPPFEAGQVQDPSLLRQGAGPDLGAGVRRGQEGVHADGQDLHHRMPDRRRRPCVTFTAAEVEKNVLSLTTSHWLKDRRLNTSWTTYRATTRTTRSGTSRATPPMALTDEEVRSVAGRPAGAQACHGDGAVDVEDDDGEQYRGRRRFHRPYHW